MEAPINDAMSLKKKGFSKDKIAEELTSKGYKRDEVSSALNQLDIKSSVQNYPRDSSANLGGGMQPSMLDQVPEPPEPPREEIIEKKEIIKTKPIISSQKSYSQSAPSLHETEQLIESIIDDKWQQVVESVGDLDIWKSRMDDDMTAVKQEILRLRERVDAIQQSVLGKVTEYNETMSEVGSEIKALEKVMQNILEPLTSNIKELSRITKKLKRKK